MSSHNEGFFGTKCHKFVTGCVLYLPTYIKKKIVFMKQAQCLTKAPLRVDSLLIIEFQKIYCLIVL